MFVRILVVDDLEFDRGAEPLDVLEVDQDPSSLVDRAPFVDDAVDLEPDVFEYPFRLFRVLDPGLVLVEDVVVILRAERLAVQLRLLFF